MRALAASSGSSSPAEAVLDVRDRLAERGFDPRAFAGGRGGAALVFATTHLARDPAALSAALSDVLGPLPFIGFVGASAFDGLRLEERRPGLVVLVLEGVDGYARSVKLAALGSHAAVALLADAPIGRARFLAASGEPFDASGFLPQLDEQGAPLAGALSVAPADGRGAVLAPRAQAGPTAALLSLQGCSLVTGVAQGARPLGPPREVTSAKANVIHELDGRPAFEALLHDLPAPLRSQLPRLGGALYAGMGTDDGAAWLMRNVVGLDPQSGAVAVADQPRLGSEVVFSLRDSAAARGDLEEMLQALKEGLGRRRPLAVVVFDCVARDESLFGVPLYDVERIEDRLGAGGVPVVGVAGGGEICTYGAATHLFGYSCVVAAILADEDDAADEDPAAAGRLRRGPRGR